MNKTAFSFYAPAVLIATLSLNIGLVQAEAVSITNADFETDGFVGDGFSNSPGVLPTGWSAASTLTGAFFGYLNPNNSAYLGTTGSLVAANMEGPNAFYFGTLVDGEGIQQTLAATFTADTNYDLTVAIGSRLGNSAATASLEVNLLAGATIIATETFRNAAFDGTFSDYTLNYVYTTGESILVGQALTIQFIERDTISAGEVDIDNVRLTATAIPEPGTFTVLAGLAGALVAASRRKARAPQAKLR